MDVILAEENLDDASGTEGLVKVVVIEPPSVSAPGSVPEASASASNPKDARGVIGLQLMMISTAYALAGHYDEELLDLIGEQVVKLFGLSILQWDHSTHR